MQEQATKTAPAEDTQELDEETTDNGVRDPDVQDLLDSTDELLEDLDDIISEGLVQQAEWRVSLHTPEAGQAIIIQANAELEEMLMELGFMALPCVC